MDDQPPPYPSTVSLEDSPNSPTVHVGIFTDVTDGEDRAEPGTSGTATSRVEANVEVTANVKNEVDATSRVTVEANVTSEVASGISTAPQKE